MARPPALSSRHWLLLAAILGLLAIVKLVTGYARAGQGGGQGSSNEPRASGAALDADLLLHVLFFASGAAALIYEVVWLHVARLVIGASALSVGIVLASFMGGMFLGSLLLPRWVPRARDALRVYAYLELGIAAFGVLVPLLLPFSRAIYLSLVGYGALGVALRAAIAALLLLPPTALMGATLPAIARRYSEQSGGMSRLASLYSANTIGAVVGSLLSGVYLLAKWDVWVATFVAVGLNILVGLTALRMAAKGAGPAKLEREPSAAKDSSEQVSISPQRTAPEPKTAEAAQRLQAYWVYWAIAGSGFTALGAQVVWTRLLTLLFGATVYCFAIILAVFLASLGVGSALAAFALRKGLSARKGLLGTQVALMLGLLWSSWLLAKVLPFSSPMSVTPVGALHALHVLRAADVIAPAAALWGMAFPFALAAGAASHVDPAQSSGRVYAANTAGAILGALCTSFWFIPAYGTQFAQQALVVVAALSAAGLIWVSPVGASTRSRAFARPLKPAWLLGCLAIGALAAAYVPALSQVFLAHGRYLGAADPRDKFLYVSEGAASTVAVHVAPDGTRHFHVSGRVEASNNPADLRLERLLGHLSALAHERPKSVLVVGLGAGVTAGAFTLHPEIERIVICEIEPRVAGAAAQFAAENYAVLSHPKVQVVFDDARHFLETTSERFDIITSDPIHPWVRGNSVLFSREYYEIVRSKLKPGGIATQWVPLYETSEKAIQIQMRTFADAFPNGTVWNSAITGRGYDVVLLGRREPLRLDLHKIEERIASNPKLLRSLRDVRIYSALDLLSTYATRAQDMRRWLDGADVNHDFSLKLEYISGLALNEQAADPIYANMVAARTYPEDLFAGSEPTLRELRQRLKSARVR